MLFTNLQKQISPPRHLSTLFNQAVPGQTASNFKVDPIRARFASKHRWLNVLAVGLAVVGIVAIAPMAAAQSEQAVEPSLQAPTCIADSQGLMCRTNENSPQNGVPALPKAMPANVSTSATVSHGLSATQMEQISNALLGILYFVLPVGFGLGLFLHDRYQAYRVATLEAQIKLLEKMWEQSPQA
ncbi:MAG: hypothetical protein KME45_17985 [Stenomitos rutilans HA7619-LM2]|jgi:hypothetical protein|nr:hypothetical protein [Stenomitos rutilans HA7619-LM2]